MKTERDLNLFYLTLREARISVLFMEKRRRRVGREVEEFSSLLFFPPSRARAPRTARILGPLLGALLENYVKRERASRSASVIDYRPVVVDRIRSFFTALYHPIGEIAREFRARNSIRSASMFADVASTSLRTARRGAQSEKNYFPKRAYVLRA